MRLIDADRIKWHRYLIQNDDGTYRTENVAYESEVNHLPPVTPEPKRGRWEDCGVNGWRCSNCRYEVVRYNNTAFCPNCGFDMRYQKEEDDNV